MMGIPYTGSGVLACIRASDKVLAKHAMRDRGIPTPDFFAFNETAFKELGAAQALPAIEERLQFPIVVKPASQGSALGIKFARTPAEVPGGAGGGVLVRPQGAARALRRRAVTWRSRSSSEDGGAAVAADRRGRARAGGLLRLRGPLRDRSHAVRVPGRARRAGRLASRGHRARGLRSCSAVRASRAWT